MRNFLLGSTIVFFVLVLIIIFQNLANDLDGVWILLYQFDKQSSATLGILIITGLGFLLGVLTTMLIITMINLGKDDEAPGGSDW